MEELHTIRALILRTTFKALLLEWQNENEPNQYASVWVPRSVIVDGDAKKENDETLQVIEIKNWWWINHEPDITYGTHHA